MLHEVPLQRHGWAFSEQEREAIAQLEEDARRPLYLPSIEEVEAQVVQLVERLEQDPEGAKEALRRWLQDGTIRVGPTDDGAIIAEGALLPFVVISDGGSRKGELRGTGAEVPRRSTVVAGARTSSLRTLTMSSCRCASSRLSSAGPRERRGVFLRPELREVLHQIVEGAHLSEPQGDRSRRHVNLLSFHRRMCLRASRGRRDLGPAQQSSSW